MRVIGRLHPGDAPVARFVQVCSAEGRTRGYAQFSQNVLLVADRPALSFAGQACTRNMADAASDDHGPPTSALVTFDCPGAPLTGDVRFELLGLTTPSGAHVTMAGSATTPFEASTDDASRPETFCLRWQL